MDLTTTAYGTWSGGRFMHFGEKLSEDQIITLTRRAYEKGVRTFVTADVYGAGEADEVLGKALSPFERDSYCLVGTIGHDFYNGKRAGSRGYPRFTQPELRGPEAYGSYLREAAEKSLQRCATDRFDLLMLHNPDSIGYTHPGVWEGMASLKEGGLTERVGVAPGPANGFAIDLAYCFENFGEGIDWAMLILNPLEPWPGQYTLKPAEKYGVKVLARVVDHGGVFHGDVRPGHHFREGDHRAYRPEGWVEAAWEKISKMEPIAERHGLSLLHFACQWNLAHPCVRSVVPTLIQEAGEEARPIEEKLDELAALPEDIRLTPEEVAEVSAIGDNEGCMLLKGASERHEGKDPEPDQWPMSPELSDAALRWGVNAAW